MSKNVENSTKLKAAKIPVKTWEQAKGASIKRRCGLGDILAVSVGHFITLPAAQQQQLVDDFKAAA